MGRKHSQSAKAAPRSPVALAAGECHWKDQYSQAAWMVPILPGTKNMLNKRSAADAFQVRSVSKERFIQKIGVLETDRLNMILSAIQIVVGIG